jgi:hypothetical protein
VTNNTFRFNTFSADGNIVYSYINCNGIVYNVSGSPTGSSLSVNLNASRVSCLFAMNLVGYGFWSFNQSYRFYSPEPTSMVSSAHKIAESTEKVWLTLLAFIIMTLIAMGLHNKISDSRVSVGVFFIGTVFFVYLGWIDYIAGGVSATICALLLFMGSR